MATKETGSQTQPPYGDNREGRAFEALETIALTSAAPHGTGGLTAPGGALDLARVAQQSMARLLGTSAGGDPKRLLARLGEVFPETTQNGSRGISYRPLGAQPVEGPAGALVAGAQTVFYRQAQDLRQQINMLLDRLEPVVTDPDEEAIETLVAAYRRTVDMIVEEYGREGGGAPDRIELGAEHLGAVREALEKALGLADGRDPDALDLALLEKDSVRETMVTLQSQTDFLTEDLRKGYVARVLNGVGVLFARLTWTVRAVPASVAQVRAEFDALRIDEADRLLLVLDRMESGTMNAELLLRWCESAAAGWMEALAEGRSISIDLVRSEAGKLQGELKALQAVAEKKRGSTRLVTALDELAAHMESIRDLACRLGAKASGSEGKGHSAPTLGGGPGPTPPAGPGTLSGGGPGPAPPVGSVPSPAGRS